ncbi:MAG: arylamine N-acetyltransferase [Sulfurovaceae bacterium]|nr:arylamine N-acetyltransferase [Sulfurovaceae bacterium]
MQSTISIFESIINQQLTLFPFHNLGLLLKKTPEIGGTCFEQSLKLKQSLKEKGYTAYLHEAEVCLTGKKCHNLVRVEYQNSSFFLDAGSGWVTKFVSSPLLPVKKYKVAGVQFEVKPEKEWILIRRYNGKKWIDMNKIDLKQQNEQQILKKFDQRYNIVLPFQNELRFCWLDKVIFYRITGTTLSIYKKGEKAIKKSISKQQVIDLVKSYFPLLTKDLEIYFYQK